MCIPDVASIFKREDTEIVIKTKNLLSLQFGKIKICCIKRNLPHDFQFIPHVELNKMQ